MHKLKSKLKTYGFFLGIIIIGMTTAIGVMTATPLDKGKVHLNIQMAASLVSCVCIGITVLSLTWNVFVNMCFSQDIGLWLFILLLFQLILMIDAEGKRHFWSILLVCINMVLVFAFIYIITSFYEIWKNWKEEMENRELCLWKIVYGESKASRDVHNYRIALLGSPVSSTTSSRKVEYDSDDDEWDKVSKEPGKFIWSEYSASAKASINSLNRNDREEMHEKQTKEGENERINDDATEDDPTKECESEETLENFIVPNNSDEGTSYANK